MDVNKNIKEICESKRISIKDLSNKIGMSFSGLYTALNNDTLKIVTLKKIAKTLDVPITVFFETGKINLDKDISEYFYNPVIKFLVQRYNKYNDKIFLYRDYIIWSILSDMNLNVWPILPYIQGKPRTIVTSDEKIKLPKYYKYVYDIPFSKWDEEDKTPFITDFFILDAFYVTIFEMNFMYIRDLLEDETIKNSEIITYWEKWKKWKET